MSHTRERYNLLSGYPIFPYHQQTTMHCNTTKAQTEIVSSPLYRSKAVSVTLNRCSLNSSLNLNIVNYMCFKAKIYQRALTLIPATGGGGKLPPPSTVFVESLIFPNKSRRWFLWHCYRPPGLSETVEIISISTSVILGHNRKVEKKIRKFADSVRSPTLRLLKRK